MFNPFPIYESRYLSGFQQKGVVAFVKQTYPRGKNLLSQPEWPAFLLSHYTEPHMARNHFDAIAHDPDRKLLEMNNAEHVNELLNLGRKEEQAYAYMYFKHPNAEEKAKRHLDKALHAYIDHKLQWRISRSEGVHFSLEFIFGEIYVVLKSGGRMHKVKIEDVETQSGYVL